MQRFEGLLNGHFRIPAMDLIEVYIVSAESTQTGVDFTHNVAAREATTAWARAHYAVNLRRNDHFVAPGEIGQSAADDFLAPS